MEGKPDKPNYNMVYLHYDHAVISLGFNLLKEE